MAIKAPVVAGKYTLLRRLGAGGMAEVFLAKQASEGNVEKLVVIKRILPHLASGPSNRDFVAMFLDEARLASDLRHPNVVTIIDVGKTSDTYYIVMEFLHGQDVRKMQRKNAAWNEQIPLGHCCQVAISAAAGLHYAHNKKDLSGKQLGIVHRDISPQNILITYEGATKIVDFGIAKAATQTTHTSVGVLKGKYTYMSPEQAAGEVVDPRTDQFALGIVLWELLTMRRLFKRDTEMLTLEAIMNGTIPRPSRFREDLPKGIDDVVMKALSKRRDDRFHNCEEMALALEDELATLGVVHSQSRLAQYMRRLFADLLAEEATLGLVNPDGSLSRNLTPFTLPPADDGGKFEKAEKPERSEKPEQKSAPTDATLMDRKRSKDDTSSKALKKRTDIVQRVVPSHTGPTLLASESKKQRPIVVEEDEKKSEVQKTMFGAWTHARMRAAIIGTGILFAIIVVATYAFWSSYAASGPATLIVRSEPRGAHVLLDGKDTGQDTPALLRDVDAGIAHKVRLELSGKKAREEIVTIPRRGTTFEVRIDLE